jgi:hypothetical protein
VNRLVSQSPITDALQEDDSEIVSSFSLGAGDTQAFIANPISVDFLPTVKFTRAQLLWSRLVCRLSITRQLNLESTTVWQHFVMEAMFHASGHHSLRYEKLKKYRQARIDEQKLYLDDLENQNVTCIEFIDNNIAQIIEQEKWKLKVLECQYQLLLTRFDLRNACRSVTDDFLPTNSGDSPLVKKLRAWSRYLRRLRHKYTQAKVSTLQNNEDRRKELKVEEAKFEKLWQEARNYNVKRYWETLVAKRVASSTSTSPSSSRRSSLSADDLDGLRRALRSKLQDDFFSHQILRKDSFFTDGLTRLEQLFDSRADTSPLVNEEPVVFQHANYANQSPEVKLQFISEKFTVFLAQVNLRRLTFREGLLLSKLISCMSEDSDKHNFLPQILYNFDSIISTRPTWLHKPNRLFQLILSTLPTSFLSLCGNLFPKSGTSILDKEPNFWNAFLDHPEALFNRCVKIAKENRKNKDSFIRFRDFSLPPQAASDILSNSPVIDISALFASDNFISNTSGIDLNVTAVIDSGCPISLTHNYSLLSNCTPCNYIIHTAKNDKSAVMKSKIRGDMTFLVRDHNEVIHKCTIRGVLYVPQVPRTLVSVLQLNLQHFGVMLDYPRATYISLDHKSQIPLQLIDQLYILHFLPNSVQTLPQSIELPTTPDISQSSALTITVEHEQQKLRIYDLWHCRLCHVGSNTVCRAHEHFFDMPKVKTSLDGHGMCPQCLASKARLSNQRRSQNHPDRLLSWWSLDVIIMKIKSVTGANILSLYVDDLSKYCIGFPNSSRTEHLPNLKKVVAFLEYLNTSIGTDYKVTCLRTDNAPEYATAEVLQFYLDHFITHHLTTPYNPRQNSIVERRGGIITQMSRSIMLAANVPETMWPFAVLHAIYVHNRLPQVQDVSGTRYSPYELIYKKPPSSKDIRVFGCLVYLHLPRPQHRFYGRNWKTSCRGIPCVYLGLGYFRGQKAFLGWSISKKKVFASDSAKFCETIYPCRPIGNQIVDNLQQFYNPEIDLPEKFDDMSEYDLPEYVDTPLTVLSWDPVEDLWNFEADEIVSVDLLSNYHNLSNIDIFSDVVPPELESDAVDEWNYQLDQQNRGTIDQTNNIPSEAPRFQLNHQFSLLEHRNAQQIQQSLLEQYSDIPVSISNDNQKNFNDEMIRIQKNIDDLLDFHRSQETQQQVAEQEAEIRQQTNATEHGLTVTFADDDDHHDTDTEVQTFPEEPTLSEALENNNKLNFVEWNSDLISMLHVPIKIHQDSEEIEFSLTDGKHVLVPIEVIQEMNKTNTTPPSVIQLVSDSNESSGPKTRSQTRNETAKRDFMHFDVKGKPIGTLSYITKAIGKKWAKLKAKVRKDDVPLTWAECLNSEERDLWIEAVFQELLSLHLRGTFSLVKASVNDKVYNSRLVCRKKRNAFTNVIKCKARIVVQGFAQVEGVDYHDVFSPTVGAVAVRTLIACANFLGYQLYHIDITTAFLSAPIDDHIILVRPPKGLEHPDGYVWKLDKALYGLKQSPRLWYKRITSSLRAFGFSEDPNETHLWRYLDKDTSEEILLCLYVDDLLFAVSDDNIYQKFHSFLSKEYPVGEAGPVKEFLSVKIEQNLQNGTTTLHQTPYLESLLEKFSKYQGITSYKSPIPKLVSVYFGERQDMCNADKHKLYREIVGSLLYLSIWTRPDISFAVSVLSRFLHAPAMIHLDLAFRVLGYLKRKPLLGLVYSKMGCKALSSLLKYAEPSLILYGYADASWNDNPDDCRSTSGFVMMVGSTAVSWCSKRQPIVALSTAEAEYISATRCGQEACHIRMMLDFFGFPQDDATIIFEDNNACIQMSDNAANTSRTKHINLRKFYLKELVRRRIIHLIRVSTHDQHADFLTKAVDGDVLSRHHRFVCGYSQYR